MTRRRLPLNDRAHRIDVHLYSEHDKIIDLTITKWTLGNVSAAMRYILETFGKEHLTAEIEIDAAAEAERQLEAFKQAHDGKVPSEIQSITKVQSEIETTKDSEHDQAELDRMYGKLEDARGKQGREGAFNVQNFVEGNIEGGRFVFKTLTSAEVHENMLMRLRSNGKTRPDEQLPGEPRGTLTVADTVTGGT
jgi:hypothetical protein